MAYRLVKGEFHLFYEKEKRVGSQPDGDSVWFRPNKAKYLRRLGDPERNAQYNKGGFCQLRFEAIDALELHYKGAHQEFSAASGARGFTLKQLGFQQVEYSGGAGLSVKLAAPHPRPGYILTKSIDPYGRPVSFVFAGATNRADGGEVFLSAAWTAESVNAKLAKSGNAYPAFYTGLPTDLRNRVLGLANSARKAKSGLWPKDDTIKGATIANLTGLELLTIWPKLFRRLVSYFKDGNHGLANLDNWLRADPERDDQLWIISQAELANMHDVLRVSGNKLSMKYRPDDLIIVPR